jgi:hypothetical protein
VLALVIKTPLGDSGILGLREREYSR